MKVIQEPDRVPGNRVLAALAGVVVFTIAGVLAAYLIADRRATELANAPRVVPYLAPAPQATPAAVPGQMPEEINQIEQVLFVDRAPGLEERRAERAMLGRYGWVDRQAGLVRIPIERAMELYVQQRAARRATEATP
jgi:hypothetical protein